MMKRALILMCVSLLAASATAATYYVSPAGNDNNAGTSDAPVKTIAKGISKATQAGDVVSVADGDYEIGSKITVSKAITIRGNVADCSKVVVNCKGVQHALSNESVDGWSVSGFTFTNIYRVVYSKKAVTVSHCVFRDVKSGSTLGGEALCFPDGTVDGRKIVEDCLFDNLYSGGKGAIYLDKIFPISVRRCIFRGCYGGGIRQNQDSTGGGIELTAEDCEFSDCGGWGGAVNLMGNNLKTQYFRNCLFVRNDATVSGWTACGSAVTTKNSFGVYENCTFADNTCSKSPSTSAAAVYANGGSSTFVNCIFWNNLHMNGNGGPVTAETSVSGTYTATNCAAPTAAALTGDTNIKLSASPFADGVYTLAGGDNPCLGSGVKLDWMTEDSKDLAGNSRLRGNDIVDLGCYEFVETGSFKGFLMLID